MHLWLQIFGCPEKIPTTFLQLCGNLVKKIRHLYVLIVPHENFPTIAGFLEAVNRKNSRFLLLFKMAKFYKLFYDSY